MAWRELSTAIYTLAAADTGAGGLFGPSGDQVITAWSSNEAAHNAAFPYCVAQLEFTDEEDVFTAARRGVSVGWRVLTYHDKRISSSYIKQSAVTDRVITLFRRTILTVTGWTASETMYEGLTAVDIDADYLQSIQQFTTFIAK